MYYHICKLFFGKGILFPIDKSAELLIIISMEKKSISKAKEKRMPDVPNLAIEELKRRVAVSSQKAVAEQLDITPQYLSDILNGRRGLSDNIVFKLGFVKVSVYAKPQEVGQVVRAVAVALDEKNGMDRLREEITRKIKQAARL